MNDLRIASKYLTKARNAKENGNEFDLPFTSFKNLMKAKRCAYTGLTLTEPRSGKPARSTDRTIDRVDATLGYHVGNVVACSAFANSLKGNIENPTSPLSMSHLAKMVTNVSRRVKL